MYILLVEEKPDSSAGLALILERAGYSVSRVASLDEASALARRQLFSMVLGVTDRLDERGWRFLCNLLEECPDLPAVAVTGRTGAADKKRILDVGYAAHVTRPFSINGLLQVLQWVLGHGPQALEDSPRQTDEK
jgi:two-component system CheB/CheR fusion protein